MNTKKTPQILIKLGLMIGLVTVTGVTMMVATATPAAADSSFSISFSTNDFSIGYRTVSGDGGYRYWNPGSYDRHHRWCNGYYSGPVVYFPNHGYDNGGPRHFDNDNRGPGYGYQDGGSWNNDRNRQDNRDNRENSYGDNRDNRSNSDNQDNRDGDNGRDGGWQGGGNR